MSVALNQIKPIILTLAMLVAVALNCDTASAAQTQSGTIVTNPAQNAVSVTEYGHSDWHC